MLYDSNEAKLLQRQLPFCQVLTGPEGLLEAATDPSVEQVLFAMSGSQAIAPCLEAITAGKTILLANKEILVSAGFLIMQELRKQRGILLPVDSEHSAIYQSLSLGRKEEVDQIVLTASGGPFLGFNEKRLAEVSVEDALRHPQWKMGRKISVDSSTLMNKGLEVIEAHHLFSFPRDQIGVLIHPESIVHGLVRYRDGQVIAHCASPDMRTPLQYALFYPERLDANVPLCDFAQLGQLTFSHPDTVNFPCLEFAWQALLEKHSFACTLNAANEELVCLFLERKIRWQEIATSLEKILSLHRSENMLSLEDVFSVDKEARILAKESASVC